MGQIDRSKRDDHLDREEMTQRGPNGSQTHPAAQSFWVTVASAELRSLSASARFKHKIQSTQEFAFQCSPLRSGCQIDELRASGCNRLQSKLPAIIMCDC